MTQETKLSTQELLLAEGLLFRAAEVLKSLMNDGTVTTNIAQVASTATAKALAKIADNDELCAVVINSMVNVIASADAHNLMRQQYANENVQLKKEVERLNGLLTPNETENENK
ncbi:hypothetical protein ACNO5E_04725 [Vibrio parahaemolyticus]